MFRPAVLVVCLAAAVAGAVPAQGPPAAGKPWYVDDDAYVNAFAAKLSKLAAAGKCLAPADVVKKTAKDGKADVPPAAPAEKVLAPEDVYKLALPAVYAVGCVKDPAKPGGEYDHGWFATAWAVGADGVLVTNWHVFENPEKAHFGVANAAGEVFPVTDILAVNKKADVAVFRVPAKNLPTLAVASAPAEVGSWVGVLSHPGHQWFTFTQGSVTRYTKNFGGPEAKGERWMSVTADYAGGSSGGPVLNKFGAVVGMACLTSNIDYEGDDAPPAADEKDKPKPRPDEKDKPKPAADAPPKDESRVQMIVKLTAPAAAVRRVLGAEKKP